MPVCLLAYFLSSCSSHETSKLNSQSKIATSIAAEGVLLTEFVQGGHSTASYTRGHAEFLAAQSRDLLADLNKLEVTTEEQQKLQELRALAKKLEEVTISFPAEKTQAFELDKAHEQFITLFHAAERLRGMP